MARGTGSDGHVDVDVDGHDRNAHDHHDDHPHVVPLLTYFLVFGALMVGTYLTVWAAGKDFGPFNTVVALAIAVTKATLVILFFMHVKYSTRLTQLVVAAAVAFLGLLILGIVTDYYSPHLDGRLHPAEIQRQ
jgi:cytochrome c oxidase subunit IV